MEDNRGGMKEEMKEGEIEGGGRDKKEQINDRERGVGTSLKIRI